MVEGGPEAREGARGSAGSAAAILELARARGLGACVERAVAGNRCGAHVDPALWGKVFYASRVARSYDVSLYVCVHGVGVGQGKTWFFGSDICESSRLALSSGCGCGRMARASRVPRADGDGRQRLRAQRHHLHGGAGHLAQHVQAAVALGAARGEVKPRRFLLEKLKSVSLMIEAEPKSLAPSKIIHFRSIYIAINSDSFSAPEQVRSKTVALFTRSDLPAARNRWGDFWCSRTGAWRRRPPARMDSTASSGHS